MEHVIHALLDDRERTDRVSGLVFIVNAVIGRPLRSVPTIET